MRMIVGVDEAGRGPLAGCVVACALYIKGKINLPLKDSKSISRRKRENFFAHFKDKTYFSLGLATHEEIDRYNILQATFIAFDRAIASLIKKHPQLNKSLFIVDGNCFKTKLPIEYHCLKKADEKIYEVAYASIAAKLFRDYLMSLANVCFPEWNFIQHKGYPTAGHINLIRRYNLSPLHRRSFSPCVSAGEVC